MATMVSDEARKRNEAVLAHLGTFKEHLGITHHGRLRLSLGDKVTYYTHPDIGESYRIKSGIMQLIVERNLDESLVEEVVVDDRLTIETVADIVEKIECAIYGYETQDGNMDTFYNIWDEGGIGVSPEIRYGSNDSKLYKENYWPSDWNYAYVMHGNSEGYYLHVDCGYRVHDANGKQTKFIKQGMLSGKSFGDWEKLYESAARISYLLQWPI